MNTPMKRLAQAGFTVTDSSDGPTRWGVSQSVFRRAARFQRFIKEVVLDQTKVGGLVYARMVALDGVPIEALDSISKTRPYSLPSGAAVEWETLNPLRTERRLLSPMTLQCYPLSATGTDVNHPEGTANPSCSSQLETYLRQSETYKELRRPLDELELDALCGWHEMVPASLFAHLVGLQPLSALPKSVLARNETRLALVENNATIELEESSFAELVDTTLDSKGEDSSPNGVDLILSVLKDRKSSVDGVTKRAWLTDLVNFRIRFSSFGPITCLLATWVSFMLEEGTIGTNNPTADTVARYAREAAQPLRVALSTLNQELVDQPWRTDLLHGVYTSILLSHGPKNSGTLRSALTNFHHFLSECFDLEPLRVPLPGEKLSAGVKANVVWEHELKLARAWSVDHPDVRVGASTRLMLGIAAEAPARIEELQRLRMRHVSFFKFGDSEFAEIEVARHAASGRLKTINSQRRLTVRNPSTLEFLKDWYAQRQAEGAPLSSYLFGDPGDDTSRYRAGVTHAFANRLLKAATGDRSVSFHSLRHGVISLHTQAIWQPDSAEATESPDVNHLEVLAAEAGHATPVTTLTAYSHLYENPLRQWLDHGIWTGLNLTSKQAGQLMGAKADAVRQQAHRHHLTLETLAQSSLNRAVAPRLLTLAKAADGLNWSSPLKPRMSTSPPAELMAVDALEMLYLLYEGTAMDTVARRYSWPSIGMHTAVAKLTNYCTQRAHALFPRRCVKSATELPTLSEVVDLMDINLERARQSKYKPLLASLGEVRDPSRLTQLVKAWEALQRGSFLTLVDMQTATVFLSCLAQLNTPGVDLRICVATNENSTPTEQHVQIDRVAKLFKVAFLYPPKITKVKMRVDRPEIYLLWDSQNSNLPSSAGSSIEGLQAIMLSIKFHLLLNEELK